MRKLSEREIATFFKCTLPSVPWDLGTTFFKLFFFSEPWTSRVGRTQLSSPGEQGFPVTFGFVVYVCKVHNNGTLLLILNWLRILYSLDLYLFIVHYIKNIIKKYIQKKKIYMKFKSNKSEKICLIFTINFTIFMFSFMFNILFSKIWKKK